MDNEPVDELLNHIQFKDLHWYRSRAQFQAKKNSSIMKGHTVSVFQAIVKAVSSKTPAFSSLEKENLPTFHIVDQNHTFKMTKGQIINVDFLFSNIDTQNVTNWAENLATYLNTPPNNRTLELIKQYPIEKRNYNTLAKELSTIPKSGELCLEFLMPLPLKHHLPKSKTYISKEEFIKLYENRIKDLFNKTINYFPNKDDFQIITNFLAYRSIEHQSKSQPGTCQLISGVVGRLYLKGTWPNFLPYLILGSEIHTGHKHSNSQGYYRLHSSPQPCLSKHFPKKDKILKVLDIILDRYDQIYNSLPGDKNHPFDKNNFADSIYNELKNHTYKPSPALPTGQITLKDLVVYQYLRKDLYKHTGLFEDWGLVKKIKRENLIDRIKNFFPNADNQISNLLEKIVQANFIKTNQTQNQIINQKNPLTPCLAGIYYQYKKKSKTQNQTSLILNKPGISLNLYGDWLEINNGTAPQENLHIDAISEIEVPGNCKISANVLKACKERDIELRTQLGSGYTTTIIEATKKQ